MSRFITALLLSGALTLPAYGQLQVPSLILRNDSVRSSVSAKEAAYHVTVLQARITRPNPDIRNDSAGILLAPLARQWVQALTSHAQTGIQLDPYGQLRVVEGAEAQAARIIKERVSTPGLSLVDKGYTYLSAVMAFADAETPERLGIAERYATSLDALGDSAALSQFRAHRLLSGIYYAHGLRSEVKRHAEIAVSTLSKMEFPDRVRMYKDANFYSEIIDVLVSEANSQGKIDALNKSLIAAANPPVQMVRLDSGFVRTGQAYVGYLREMMKVALRVGAKAQDIEGNYWVNLPQSSPQTISVTDGRIRVLEMGHYSCPQCRTAMRMLQRLHVKFPEIQVITATATQGSWGNRTVEPSIEAEHLKNFYQNSMGITYPMSIWQGPLKPTEDGGMLPENYGPNFTNYPLVDKPNIYVIDGRGVIRRVFVGAMTLEREANLVKLVEFLTKEQ